MTPPDEVDTEAGGRGGTGGTPARDELAGGTTTGGAGCPGPATTDEAACCSACGISAGRDTIVCSRPTHGTPPRPVLAVACGLSIGALKNIAALPIITMTMPCLVRDMCSPVLLRRAVQIAFLAGAY
ncbi:hypothetical protein CRI77_24860 [Mycolicibacterium duvalii]|nr:hypothetical protein CRI77_24860 [Mycolicibacterium duvalii]